MRFKLKQIAFVGLLACFGASAIAANYFFVQPKSLEMSKASALSVALNPGTLPEAVVGMGYNGGVGFDLKSLLVVTGDSGFNAALASFSVTAGTLPTGLTVSATGVLSGTPTVASAGSSIQVTATYKNASGAQTYQVISLNITVALAAATLQAAKVGTLYNDGTGYDFKPLLAVTGDAAYSASQSYFKLADGSSLPDGLVLSKTGLLSGTPRVATSGTSFLVQASYKTKTGQQAYTIVVNGVTLQVVNIALGMTHTCAITLAGAVKCWGSNLDGQLGNGTTNDSLVPIQVDGLGSGVTAVAAGGRGTDSNASCAVHLGAVKCWGYGYLGRLGSGISIEKQLTPVITSGLTTDVANVVLGMHHACAIRIGAVWCWGANNYKQMANQSTTTALVPSLVNTGADSWVTKIVLGDNHTCALLVTGVVKCWGHNGNGAVGAGELFVYPTWPATVSLPASAVALAAGGESSCALLNTGAVRCWGDNSSGQLGRGFLGSSANLASAQVIGLAGPVSEIAIAPSHACAILTSGLLQCWGKNDSGQLGLGDLATRLAPTTVTALTGIVTALSVGKGYTCATTAAQGAQCWGLNVNGQLGDGTKVNKMAPTTVLP